jgi:mannose-6-phosphate isomerase-like protein (cupin superfamily)
MKNQSSDSQAIQPLPPDDLKRGMKIARPNTDSSLPHIGLAGDTYTTILSAYDTNGRYCLIDMYVPPGGGPLPHRHDFEESFTIIEGEIEATFRGRKTSVQAGETLHIPANAPHSFRNISNRPARMLCICAPAGLEEFFARMGVKVAQRTTSPPQLDDAAQVAFVERAKELAPTYRTELLPP